VHYRCEATTLEGFLQQLAVCYVGRGYWFYVTGFIHRDDKDPREVDQKLIEKYGIDISKWARARRKRSGTASVQYIRYQRFFVLLATVGYHRFKIDEQANIYDVRTAPITFSNYAVGCRRGHACVRIEREEYLRIKAYFLEIACRRPESQIAAELKALPFEPYAAVLAQYLEIVDAINDVRAQAGMEKIPRFSVRWKRGIYRPFEPVEFENDHPLKTGTG
jgi:hypothetical protein